MDKYWQNAVRSLQASGMTQLEIGRRIGLSRTAVNDIACGLTTQPSGWAAVKLHKLAEQLERRLTRASKAA